MTSWWVLDRVLLDRVFQRSANYLHEQVGYTPREVAQFFGIGSVLAIGFREYLLVGSLTPTMHLLHNLVFPLIFLMVPFMPERLSDNGRNIKRWYLFPARAFTLLFTFYLLFVANYPNTLEAFENYVLDLLVPVRDLLAPGMVLPTHVFVDPVPLFPTIVYAISMAMIWAEVCFCSVDQPPPRKFRSAKTWNMAG